MDLSQSPSENFLTSSAKSIYNKISDAKNSFVHMVSKAPALSNIANLQQLLPKDIDEELSATLKTAACQTLQKTELNDVTIISEICNPRTIETKFYEKNYTVYDIVTAQMKWNVIRRYSDFVWLRECLTEMFPTEIVPQLPKKKIGSRRFDGDFVAKRMKKLQKFLNEIIVNEDFKSSDVLKAFLSTPERSFFENQMKMYAPKNLKICGVQGFKNISGTIEFYNISDVMKYNSFFNNTCSYFKFKANLLHCLHKNLNAFHSYMTNAYLALNDIQNNCEDIMKLSQQVELNANVCNVFQQYYEFFKNWKQAQIKQTLVIKDVFNNFIKDYYDYCQSYTEVIQREEDLRNKLIVDINNLNIQKEKLWNTMDTKNWQLNPLEPVDQSKLFNDKDYAKSKMLYTYTNTLNNKLSLIQVYFRKIYQHIIYYYNHYQHQCTQNLEAFSEQFGPALTEAITVWTYLTSNLKVE